MLFTAAIRYGIGDVLGSCRVPPEECFRCRKEEEVEEALFEVRISGTVHWLSMERAQWGRQLMRQLRSNHVHWLRATVSKCESIE